MTEAATERKDTDLALSALARRVDRIAERVETLIALVGRLHTDSREALALGFAACESDLHLVVVLRKVLSILDQRGRTLPEDLRFADVIEQADAELRIADQEIERSAAHVLGELRDGDAQ